MSGHHHRSGGLSQSNKKNKRSNASKRSVGRLNGGRVEGRVGIKHRLVTHNKADRRHIQQQKRETKRVELLRRKRGLDGGPPPPRVIGVISLGESEQTEEKLRSLILDQADSVYKTYGEDNNSTISAKYEVHKKDGNLTILTNSTAFRSHYSTENGDDSAVLAALDLARVCDMIIFVVDGNAPKPGDNVLGISIGGDDQSVRTNKTSATSQDFDHLISERGDRILAAVKGQGLPRLLTILARTEKDKEPGEDYMTTQSAKSLRRGNLKRKTDLKKYVSRFATTEFGIDNEKVVEVDLTETDFDDEMEHDDMDDGAVDPDEHMKNTLAASLVRILCTTAASPSKWVANMPRAYVLSDSHQYNPETQELQITGYIRGIVPFEINALMHVPNLGTFACKAVKKATRPNARKIKDTGKDDDAHVLESDPMKREHLEMFATPDSLEGEQNLIGFDEAEEDFDENDEEEEKEGEKTFARPAGWSDYQSAWLDAVEDGGSVGEGEMDNGELAKELNKKSSKSVAPDEVMDLDDANMVSEEERRALLEQRRKEQQEHQEFPDEVQVQEDEKARDRFARYRSLKSFRQSPWDAKENLPESYASVFHFASFKSTQRSVMSEMKYLAKAARLANENFWGRDLNKNESDDAAMDASDDEDEDLLEGCVPSGCYITLVLEKVSQKAYSGVSPDAPLAVVTLLAHENKVSVLHMGLSQNQGCQMSQDAPVKSKDVLTFRCGWRTWTGRPVFSQHNLNSDKHKFERFLPQGGAFFAASVFGPVTYTHCPVLVFRDHKGQKELVSIGSMIGADADRIVVKRIVLTGYPVRVHKRFATVKYMFNDPEDVKWFKPAGLTTKHGLNGNIEASVGEHGTMKCLFNAPIKQHDTVCLPLYKRIFPKFPGVNVAGDDGGTVRSIRNRNVLVVK
jgi:pre-rRNA-processing protein TSR1